MYKVMITQLINDKVIGKAILTTDFTNINDAIRAADDNANVYDRPVYQVREYDDKRFHVISFDEQDTGKIVYEKV